MFLPRKPKKKHEGVHHKNKPVNPDPEKYSVYWTKDGWVIRRKRSGSGINASFKANADDTCATEAKEIMRVLSPFTENIGGRKLVYLSGCLRRAKKRAGTITYEECLEHEINFKHPLKNIYGGEYQIRAEKGVVYIDLPVNSNTVRRNNRAVTGYYFEFILISGDAGIPDSMRSESDRSDVFSLKTTGESMCTLSLILPEGMPYMTVLKFACMEGRFEANHEKQYGLKVVGIG